MEEKFNKIRLSGPALTCGALMFIETDAWNNPDRRYSGKCSVGDHFQCHDVLQLGDILLHQIMAELLVLVFQGI
jgi:hypothetical protein